MRRLDWLRRSWLMISRKSSEGRVPSIAFMRSNLGEVFHSPCHRFFRLFYSSCRVAEILIGRGFRRRNVGRSPVALEFPLVWLLHPRARSRQCPRVPKSKQIEIPLCTASSGPILPPDAPILQPSPPRTFPISLNPFSPLPRLHDLKILQRVVNLVH